MLTGDSYISLLVGGTCILVSLTAKSNNHSEVCQFSKESEVDPDGLVRPWLDDHSLRSNLSVSRLTKIESLHYIVHSTMDDSQNPTINKPAKIPKSLGRPFKVLASNVAMKSAQKMNNQTLSFTKCLAQARFISANAYKRITYSQLVETAANDIAPIMYRHVASPPRTSLCHPRQAKTMTTGTARKKRTELVWRTISLS